MSWRFDARSTDHAPPQSSGQADGDCNGWTEQRVRGFRKHHDIAVYRDGEWAERGEITLDAAAQIIGVTKMTALRMTGGGECQGTAGPQGCALGHQGGGRGRDWVPGSDQQAPVTSNPTQQTFEFSETGGCVL